MKLAETFGWGTIKATGPYTIKIDGSLSAVPVDVNLVGANWLVGDRVAWTYIGKQLAVIGDPRPVGEVYMDAVSTTPPNSLWVLADGSSVLRTAYPKLAARWAAAGFPWGTADSTHMNLPPLCVAPFPFPRPAATGAGGLGNQGGTSTHTHPVSDNAQAALTNPGGTQLLRWRAVPSSNYTVTNVITGSSAGTASNTHSTGIGLTGATDSASTIPVYASLAFFIKVA